jgi:NADPH2:quinone reductase
MMASQTKQGTMRAWAIPAYGGPERMQLMELPVPRVGAGDVLIRVCGAEVGDWDALVREGEWPMEREFPLVLGLAGAGTVAAAGEVVSGIAKGDRVYAYNYPMQHPGCESPDHNGAWAEYLLVPAVHVARAPESLDLTHAGSVPIVGLTAHETLVDILEVGEGDVVLITAAAGGVGHLAVQIAAERGARVVATASERSREFVRALGAAIIIDYTKESLVEAVRSCYPEGVDKALNGVGGETPSQVARCVRRGGTMVDLTTTITNGPPGVHVIGDYVVNANSDRLATLARLIDDGRLRVTVQEVVPFDRAPDALETMLTKHVHGKIALAID